ncbi:MAG: putative Zn-dependent peptidase [Verrucomicrobiales bacterium]|jgi:predicted Zn-dependent peptidase
MKSASYQTTRLLNGVTIATAEMPHMESVCVGAWVGVGSRFESPAMNGIAHFVEHLVFKGTPTRDATQISREIEELGASVGAFTTEDHTCFFTRGLTENLGELTEVLLDIVCRPTFDPAEIEREREVILEEISMYRDTPSQHVEDLLGEAAWPDHALGRPITGTHVSVAQINRGDLFSFHQTRYTGSNLIITASGKVNHDEFVRLVEPAASALEKGERATYHRVPTPMSESGPRRCDEVRDIEQSHLCIGFHACSRNDPERHALKVLSVLLGENMSSRLYQVLREEHGLCYSIYSDALPLDDTGLLSIYAGLDLDNIPQALDLIAGVLKEFAENSIDSKMIESAVNYVVGQSRLSLEGTEQQMTWCGESLLAHNRVVEPIEAFERLRNVTAADVKSLAQRVFHPSRTAVGYIGPEIPEFALDGFLM